MSTTEKLAQALLLAIETLEELQGGCTDSDDGTVEALTVWCPEVIKQTRAALAAWEAEKAAATPSAGLLLDMVLDDMKTCYGECGVDYEFKDLSTETVEALEAYRTTAKRATSYSPCKGMNCGATDGVSHSAECFAEHVATIDPGVGQRHPEYRYAGYIGASFPRSASKDQQAAWVIGVKAQVPQPAPAATPSAKPLTDERRQGYYRVRQLLGKKGAAEEFMRDFDATEWVYCWVSRFGHQVLRLERTGIESIDGSFEVAEFSAPVNIELILEDA